MLAVRRLAVVLLSGLVSVSAISSMQASAGAMSPAQFDTRPDSRFAGSVPQSGPSPSNALSNASGTAAQRQALARWREQQMRMASGHARPHRQAASTATSGGGIIETIAGSAPFQAPTTALKAGLGQTQGVVEDTNGNLFVSTGDLRTVLKIDTTGNVTVYAGKPLPSGPAQATGDGGPATAATLVFPVGLALDATGNLYIADSGSFTVREVAAATGIITTIAGVTGQFGYGGDGGPATSASLQYVQSLALDENGNLFFSETQTSFEQFIFVTYLDNVREVNLSTGVIHTVEGDAFDNSPFPNQCYFVENSSGSTCPALSLPLQIDIGPNNLAYSQGTLYLATSGYSTLSYPAILAITLSTDTAQLLLGGLYNDARLYGSSLAADRAGNLDITSSGYIYQLPAGGTTLTTIAGNGTYGYSGDGGPATSAMIGYVNGISITSSGGIVFGDTDRIRAIGTNGVIGTLAGDGTANEFGDGGPALFAGMDAPSAIALDGTGNIFIWDSYDLVVREVNAATGVISTLAGNGMPAAEAPTSGPTNSLPGDGEPATQVPVSQVTAMVADNASHIYVGTANDGIRIVNTNTGVISTLNNTLQVWGGMVLDAKGNLYFTNEGYATFAVNLTSGLSTFITGGGSTGCSAGTGDGQPAVDACFWPYGLALDNNGNLYVGDLIHESVRIVDLSTGIINTFAGPTSTSQHGYDTGDGGPATQATFGSIDGLSYDGAGHLQIADYYGWTIREVNLSTNIITTVAGTGTPGYTGDGAAATAAELNGPTAVAVDSTGNLYIADTGNSRIRRVVVQPATLSATLTATPASAPAGTSVGLSATFAGLTLGLQPALGTVTFYDGTTALSASVPAFSGTGNSFTAIASTTALAVGTHTITAQFAGDGNYAAVTTAPVTVTVTAPIPPSFTIAAAPSSLSIKQGASGTAVFTVTPAGGFNAAVNFACGSGLPTGVTCSFSPASVTPTGSTPVTTTLTITTTGATLARLNPAADSNTRPGGRWWVPTGTASLACLLLLGLPARRRTAASWFAMLACAVLLSTGWLGLAGCSGGSSGPKPNPDATPPGSYTITLTATSGTGPTALTQPGTLALTVTQ